MRRRSKLFSTPQVHIVPKGGRARRALVLSLGAFLCVCLAALFWPRGEGQKNPKQGEANAYRQDGGSSASTAVGGEEGFVPLLPLRDAQRARYFKDAVFVGDGLTAQLAGAGAFGGNGTFLSSERLNPTLLQSGRLFSAGGAEDATALAAIKAADPGKIYLLVGANGVSWLSAEDMVKSLGDFVDRLRQQHPKATIVLSTLPYFDAATQGDHPNYQNTKVEEYNRQLSALCAEKEVYLLDSAQVLSGAHAVGLRDGSLTLADGAADAWADYIFTHTAG